MCTASVRQLGACVSLLLLMLLLHARALAADTYELSATARPPRLAYAADTRVFITVDVHDAQGRSVPDNTAVFFHTTLGIMPTVAYTQHGQVAVMLQNPVGPGTAIVTITVGYSRQTLTVEYLGPGGATPPPTPSPKRVSYTVSARHAYYSIDRRVFDLRDQAVFSTPAYKVSAEAIQFDAVNGTLTAQNSVALTAGENTLLAEKLVLDTRRDQGWIVALTPDIIFKSVALPSLETHETDEARAKDFRPLAAQPTRTWIICRRATIIPQAEIMFRNPQFYLDKFDHRLYSLPNHVLSLRATEGTFFNSQVQLMSDAGISVDFPIYYVARPEHTGAIHLRHVTRASEYFAGKMGVDISVEEEYLLGDQGDGGVYIDDVLKPTRSIAWDHNHQFTHTRMRVNAAYERYTENNPYTSRFGIGLDRTLGTTPLSLSTNYNQAEDDRYANVELGSSLPPLRLSKTGWSLSFSPYLGYDYATTGATDQQPATTDTLFYQGLRTSLGVPSFRVLGGAVSTTVTDDLAHNEGEPITNSIVANTSYRRPLSRYFSSGLSYAYSLYPESSGGVKTNERVSLEISGSQARAWNLSAYSAHTLGTREITSWGSATWYLPWDRDRHGMPRWYTTYNVNVTSGDITAADQHFTLGRYVGSFAVLLHYSPTGNTAVTGLGTGTGKKWAIELLRRGW